MFVISLKSEETLQPTPLSDNEILNSLFDGGKDIVIKRVRVNSSSPQCLKYLGSELLTGPQHYTLKGEVFFIKFRKSHKYVILRKIVYRRIVCYCISFTVEKKEISPLWKKPQKMGFN